MNSWRLSLARQLNIVIWRLLIYFYIKTDIKGGEIMMALLFAQRVILDKNSFAEVPSKLKSQVADILINECGLPELVPVSYGGTAPDEE